MAMATLAWFSPSICSIPAHRFRSLAPFHSSLVYFCRSPCHSLSIRPHVLRAKLRASAAGNPTSTQSKTAIKDFLEDLKGVGRIRIIVKTGAGVLESTTSLEKLFYHVLPGRGEYANLMNKNENVDFHLLIDKIASAALVEGKSMRGDIPTYTVRFVDTEGIIAASFLIMWKPDTNGEYDPGQVEAFNTLVSKYGSQISFV